jgi:DNA-binding NtrC family response regulator
LARILVVDDEVAIRELVSKWLRDAGHEPVQAEHADAALQAMAAEPAAVVLTDVQMPGHDGLWLTGELRRYYPATAVVLATGVSTVSAQISMQFGVLAYLLKPFNRHALLGAVKQGVAWHTEAHGGGHRPDEDQDSLREWLGVIDSALKGAV